MAKLSKRAVARALAPKRKFIREVTQNIASEEERKRYAILPLLMNRGWMNTVITEQGQDSTALGTNDLNKFWRIDRPSIHYIFRNLSEHDLFLEIYECVARNDMVDNATDNNQVLVMNSLVAGWDHLLKDADVNFTGTGNIIEYTTGNDYCDSLMTWINPFKSDIFCQHFKVLKVEKGTLTPGQMASHYMRGRGFDYSPGQFDPSYAAATSQRDVAVTGIVGKVTKFLVIGLHGALGLGKDDQTNSGWMTSDIGIHITQKATVIPLDYLDQSIAVSVVEDNDLVGYEGPTDEAMADDDP
jgi:hypothetical protein